MLWNWLTGRSNRGKFSKMIIPCQHCGTKNLIPDGHDPRNYFCGQCHHRSLIPDNSTGTVITSAAVGAGIGGVFGGPGGAILGGIIGTIIGKGATGTLGDPRKKKPNE